ncbi:MAG: DUF1957 domain-containing protein [Nitrospirae bacterium]|nr:DUF1957 domain-containing protein [Nitrospirota bacterium]
MRAGRAPDATVKKQGCLAFVLHAHLPFVRHPEHEDSLEENWLYEAMTETYIPLLLVMDALVADGIDFRLTFSITPTLVSMLRDEFLQARYLKRLRKLTELAGKEVRRTKEQVEVNALARMYRNRLREVMDAFLLRYERDLVGAFVHLQKLGKLEIIASAATHGYLPLLSTNEASVRAQIRIGIAHYRRTFGKRPSGFWLPECGFSRGIDTILKEEGIRFTILETHGITHARPRPKYGVYAPLYCPSGMAVFGRDPESSRQVWSSVEGYPGDFDYREFYRDIAYDLDLDYIGPYIHSDGIRVDTGFKYFRVTGKTDHKELYVPERAERKAEIHAADFLYRRERQVGHLAPSMDRAPLIVAPYDAELFGHWWFEGPVWLDRVIRRASSPGSSLRLVTPSEYLGKYAVNQIASPAASSWGDKGFHETWHGAGNDWIHRHLDQGGLFMKRLAANHPKAKGPTLRALRQAARELLLAQASDWAFMIHRGTTAAYAVQRTKTHLLRFLRLKEGIEKGVIDEGWLSAVEGRDNIFPEIDYRFFS